jgi:thiol-disulfide isomerase/thioredoxin
VFARAGAASTDRLESAFVSRSTLARGDNTRPSPAARASSAAVAVTDAFTARRPMGLPTLAQPMPELVGALEWINSGPLTRDSLRGKVVLVDFWTFQCYNCLNALPHVTALYAKYRDRGFVVIGVHTPELPQERSRERAARSAPLGNRVSRCRR